MTDDPATLEQCPKCGARAVLPPEWELGGAFDCDSQIIGGSGKLVESPQCLRNQLAHSHQRERKLVEALLPFANLDDDDDPDIQRAKATIAEATQEGQEGKSC